jgi:O-antigen/teichoic acid export membrane protein
MNLSNRVPLDYYFNKMKATIIQSDFFSKVVGTFATRICVLALGLVTTILVARILGPEGRGIFAIAIAATAMGVQFGNFGLHASNTYYLSRQPDLLPVLLGNSLFVGLGLGSIGALIAWLIFFIWPEIAPLHGNLLLIVLISVPLGLTYLLLQNILLGLQNVKAYNGLELLNKLLTVLFFGVLIWFDWISPTMLLIAGIISTKIAISWGTLIVTDNGINRPKIGLKIFFGSIGYGSKAYISAFFSFLTMRMGLFIIQYKYGAEAAGYYSVALTMAELIYMFPVVVGNLIFPKLSSMSDEIAKRNATNRLVLYVASGMFVSCVIVWVMAEPLVQILFGAEFIHSVPMLYGLLPGVIVLSANTIYMNYFASLGMPSVTMYSPALAAALLLVCGVCEFINTSPFELAVLTSFSWLLMLTISLIWLVRNRII